MPKSILISGIAGTGKTTVCRELSKMGYQAFSIEDINGLFTRLDKRNGRVFKDYDPNNLNDVQNSSWLGNFEKLKDFVNKNLFNNNKEKAIFYGGVASNLDDLRPLFDQVFILEASPEILKKRLNNRLTNNFAQSAEVQKWLFNHQKSWEEHMEKGSLVINANQSLPKVVKDILEKAQVF